MAFNAFTEVNQVRIDKLPFIKAAYRYYFGDPQDKVSLGVVYEIAEENYIKATDRLIGQDVREVLAGDRVYVMPGSKIPMFKIKDHCKKLGASIIAEIDNATFFIGTDRIVEAGERGNWEPRASSLLWKDIVPSIIQTGQNMDVESDLNLGSHFLTTKSWESVKENLENYSYIYLTNQLGNKVTMSLVPRESKKFFLTPAGASIIYNAIAKKIPIVSENLILEQISPASVIDEYTYDSVDSMLDSDDEESNIMGAEILANCNVSKSMFYIWKLARKYYSRITSVHTKNIRLFEEQSELRVLYNLDEEHFIEHLHQKGLLTKEYFDLLIANASKNYNVTLNTSVFQIVVTPSDKYREYRDDNMIYEFHHELEYVDEEKPEIVEDDQ